MGGIYVVLEFLFPWPVEERETGNQGKSPEGGKLVKRSCWSCSHQRPLPCPETVKVAKTHVSAEEKFPRPCLSEWLGLK